MNGTNGTPRQLQLRPYHVQNLFSEHYLAEVLKDTPLWDTTGMEEVRAEVRELWEEQRDYVEEYSEGGLEDAFIRPVLRALGHVFCVQESTAGQQTPDYAFFAGDEERAAALEAKSDNSGFWNHAIAVGDAKTWDRSLDKKLSATSGWDNQNPSFQIYHYLAETGCRWGILTNGRLWRIYPGEPKPSMEDYYEVDLIQALGADDPTDFAYFFLFFRRVAFVPDEEEETFLDYVRDESDRFAAKLREDVRENVYDALRLACEGFLNYQPNSLTEDDLGDIHDNALVLLYRLLFILYAESAGLLPLDNSGYRNRYSLLSLKTETRDTPDTYTDEDCMIWPRLTNLFNIVDSGREALDVPAYNGGLFKPQRHPFLEDHALPDSYIAKIINLLAIDAEGRFADYRDLGVRHLGSIYEGLLEYRVEVADEPLRAVKDNGSEVWEGADGEEAEVAVGDVYLVTDKGERKATGSYYTPQYIVEYIVENTVGPLVEECDEPEDILELNVLDPAMGSGHFLVEVTDFLARRAAEMEVEKGETIGDDSDGDTDVQRLKRQVVERCVYGVDLNPLAVELAKLSLWLHTVAEGRPLSFLDHHLRCGNSLIGADLEDIASGVPEEKSAAQKRQEAAGQLSLFDHRQWTLHAKDLVFGFTEIEHGLSESPGDIEQKERILQNLDDVHRKPYLHMADVWCSRYFGNEFDNDTYGEMVGYLQEVNPELSDDAQEAYDRAVEIAEERRFFHWEFEFPEVFFTATGTKKPNPGFDAVVGNPPWGYLTTDRESVSFYSATFPVPSDDAFALFLQKAVALERMNGRLGQILPSGWQTASASAALRRKIMSQLRPDTIVNLPYDVFEDAYVDAIIIIGMREDRSATGSTDVCVLTYGRKETVNAIEHHDERWVVHDTSRWFNKELPGAKYLRMLTYLTPQAVEMVIRIQRVSDPLGRHADVQRGITPFNTVRESTERTAPGLVGELRRYRLDRKTVPIEYHSGLAEYKPQRYFHGPRLLLRELISRQFQLQAIWTEIDFVTNKSIQSILAVDQYVPRYLLALLNSSIISHVHIHTSAVALRDDFPKIVLAETRQLPIRIIDFDHPTEAGEKERLMERCREAIGGGDYETPLRVAKQALATHAALHGPAGKPELADDEYWSEQIDAADTDFPGREDFVHDLLAALAQRMMDLNETKHEIIERFEADLRGVAATDLHEDLGRGKQGRTLHKHECCRPYVEEGSYTTHSLHETLGWSEEAFEVFVKELCGSVKNLADMLEIYRRHADSFRQTTSALESTDTLIDQVVYALYGLTDEEIKIVEESVSRDE